MKALTWAVTLLILLLDQATKFVVSSRLEPGHSLELIKGVFAITLIRNTGAAFGIFRDQVLFFIIVSALAVIFIFFYMRRSGASFSLENLAFSLVLGGALGNLVDRLRFGYVVDFLDFRIWPVFNIADSAITFGTLLLLIALFRKG